MNHTFICTQCLRKSPGSPDGPLSDWLEFGAFDVVPDGEEAWLEMSTNMITYHTHAIDEGGNAYRRRDRILILPDDDSISLILIGRRDHLASLLGGEEVA